MINWFKRVWRKFKNALKGALVILKEENSLWVHLFFTFFVIIFGIILDISLVDWALIAIAVGLVIGFEIINTAIEYLVDIVSFEYNTASIDEGSIFVVMKDQYIGWNGGWEW